MMNSDKAFSVRLPLIIFLILAVGFVIWLFIGGTADKRSNPAFEGVSKHSEIQQHKDTTSDQRSIYSESVMSDSMTPSFTNLSPESSGYQNYVDPDSVLEPIIVSETSSEMPDSINDFIDPDDTDYQYEISNPGSVGDFIDPDDETYQREISNSGSVGDYIDPDDETYQYNISNPGSLGERVDPDSGY